MNTEHKLLTADHDVISSAPIYRCFSAQCCWYN